MPRALALAPLACLAAACVAAEGERAAVDLSVEAASQFNHRGMPQNENAVLQPEMRVGLPTADGGSLDVATFGNLDLTDDTGDAWFPGDNQGRFSELDFTLAYSRELGGFDIALGVEHYAILNGSEFVTGPAGSERGPTTELFASASRTILGVDPFLELHYDIDEVEDLYVKGGVGASFDLGESWWTELSVAQGWSGEDQSLWNYGFPEAGFADLGASAALFYQFDEFTVLHAEINATTIVDSELQDWFDVIGIESDNVWAALGIAWSL
jgi:hypothetical protein